MAIDVLTRQVKEMKPAPGVAVTSINKTTQKYIEYIISQLLCTPGTKKKSIVKINWYDGLWI